MLLVKTKINKSNIHGIGLFAAEFIPKNTIVWRFFQDFDLRINKGKLKELSKSSLAQALYYGYVSKKNKQVYTSF